MYNTQTICSGKDTLWKAYKPISHTLRSDFHYFHYICISPYRTLATVELQYMTVISLSDLIV